MAEKLAPRLRSSALTVLRRHQVSDENLVIEVPKENSQACEIRGHRIRIHLDDQRADFSVRSGRWGAASSDYPSVGAFLSEFEAALDRAISDRWRD